MPEGVPGALFLSSMPGRDGPIEQAIQEMQDSRIDRIICLTPDDEIRLKSPDYAAILKRDGLPCPLNRFPIPDFEVPKDRLAFLSVIREIRDSLLKGERVLVHCSAGFGRSGTVATCILVALGLEASKAREAVLRAGSRPEHDLVHWMAQEGQ